MKKILWFFVYTGGAVLVAFLTTLVLGWSFWAILITAGLGYFAVTLWQSNPKPAKFLAISGVMLLSCQIVGQWLERVLPFTRHTLNYAIDAQEVQIARTIDKGLSSAQGTFLIALRKQEDELAKQIKVLMAAKKYDEATNAYAVQRAIRAKIESVLEPITPPRTATSAPKNTISTYTVNKDEVISTLSVPDNSTVYLEADKAFCILERYGINPDGSEKTSKLTILPGKSSRHFVWGGTLRLVGLYTNTTVRLHL